MPIKTSSQISLTDLTDVYARIEQNEDNIKLKVGIGEVSSEISQESDTIKITGDRFIVDSTNLQIDADGSVECSNMDITGGNITIETDDKEFNHVIIRKNEDEYTHLCNETSLSAIALKISEYSAIDNSGLYTHVNNRGFYIRNSQTTAAIAYLEENALHIDGLIVARKDSSDTFIELSGRLMLDKNDITAVNNISALGTIKGACLKTPDDKVKMWTDSEGGNLTITSPNGVSYQMDAFDNNLRIYVYDANGTIHGFVFTRNGDFIVGNISLSKSFSMKISETNPFSIEIGSSSSSKISSTFSIEYL